MMADDRQYLAERLQRLADCLTIGRMPLHYIPFGGSQFASLLQDFIWDFNLSEIVQIASTLERDDVFVIKMQMATELASIVSKPRAVIACKRVSRLHSQRERE